MDMNRKVMVIIGVGGAGMNCLGNIRERIASR